MNGVKFWNTNLKSDSFEDFQLVTILDPSFLRLRFTINFVVERTRERIFRILRIVSKTMVESMLSSVSEIPSPDEFVSIPTPPRRTRFRRKLRARYAPTIALLRHKRYFYWGATRWFDRRYFMGPGILSSRIFHDDPRSRENRNWEKMDEIVPTNLPSLNRYDLETGAFLSVIASL